MKVEFILSLGSQVSGTLLLKALLGIVVYQYWSISGAKVATDTYTVQFKKILAQ